MAVDRAGASVLHHALSLKPADPLPPGWSAYRTWAAWSKRLGHDYRVISLDLPGVKKEDIKLDIRDNHLIVSGERKQEHEERESNVYRMETFYGNFQRIFALPSGVNLITNATIVE